MESAEIREATLGEIAVVFLKLGTIAFGGPAAHLAMMQEEFVRRKKWISQADFLDRLAAANLIPGPSSTEVAIFIGHLKRGWRGLIVAGCCFIIPAALIAMAIAWAYVRYGALPQAQSVLGAIKPVVVAIIIQALGKLGRSGIKTISLAVIAALAVGLNLIGVSPVWVLIIAGALAAAELGMRTRLLGVGTVATPKMVGGALAAVVVAGAWPVGLGRLFLSFLKIGSIVFGSGYVLLAFLQTEFVQHLHWLTEQQLLDAVAVGQFTPGPLSATATFIGYVVAGWKGAVVATVGIFLPGFVLVALSGPVIPRLRRSAVFSAALDGVIAGSLALMAIVTWQLGRASIVNWTTLALFVASLIGLIRFRINSGWLIAGGAVVGLFVR
ncbi:MAG: chromate efflux transporter [Terriglobales bacterium]|jgi:chromate transporter